MSSGTAGESGPQDEPGHGEGWRTGAGPRRRRETTPRTVIVDGVTGLLVPPRSVSLVVPIVLGLLCLVFLATTVGMVLSGLERGSTYGVVSGVGALALAVVLGWFAWLTLILREEGGGLLLTPASVYPRGPGPVAVDWDEITATDAGWVALPRRQAAWPGWWRARRFHNYLRLGLTPDGEARHLLRPEVAHTGAFSLPVDDYTVDPHRLRALLEHYLSEPGDRHELGTAAALTRWRAVRDRPPYRR